jgi:ABC-2 type transport system permease protein
MLQLSRLELLRLLRDWRMAIALIAFAGLFVTSGVAALLDVRQAAAIKLAVARAERARWLGQGIKDPHSAAHYSIYAFKPSMPLEAIDRGIVPFVGEVVWLEAHLQNDLLSRPQQNAQAFERLGLIDPAGLLTRLGPLVLFLLAFAAAANEREQSTLGLALASSVSRSAYVGAKVVSLTSTGIAVLVVPILIAGITGSALASQHATNEVARLASWGLAASAYIGIMAAVGVSICVLARSAQIAFAGLLVAWVLVLAALPVASAFADRTRPLPSFQQLKLILADQAPAYWTPETGAEQVATVLARYGARSDKDLEINLRGAQLDVAERHAHEVFDRQIGGFYDRVVAQDARYASLAWLSPTVAFDVVSAALTGTDFSHHRDFIDYAERYRRELVNRMNADLIPHPATDGEHTNDISLWSQVPPFAYHTLPIAAASRSSGSALLALASWAVAAVALVGWSARRLRP